MARNKPESTNDEEYYVYPTLEGSNYTEHDADHLFCDDPTCPCHEDSDNLETLQEWYSEGLIGSMDGENIYRGRTI